MKTQDAFKQLSEREKEMLDTAHDKLTDAEIATLWKLISLVEKPQYLMKHEDIRYRCSEYHKILKDAKQSRKCAERQEQYDAVYKKCRKHDKDKVAHSMAIRAAADLFGVNPKTIRRSITPYE